MNRILSACSIAAMIVGCASASSGGDSVNYTYKPLLTKFPEVAYPSLADFLRITEAELVKDKFETSSEFEKRKSQVYTQGKRELNFFAHLHVDYDADVEAYLVEACLETALHDRTNEKQRSGYTALGVEWVWKELESDQILVDAGVCSVYEIPYELSRARSLGDEISAVARVILPKQTPRSRLHGNNPALGTSIVYKTKQKVFVGGVSQIYLGSSRLGVIAAWDLGNPHTRMSMRCPGGSDAVRAYLDESKFPNPLIKEQLGNCSRTKSSN